jgi:queuine tRNA-ribosyltransferase
MLHFSVSHADMTSEARTGRLTLAHGEVITPAFMPVGTNATVKAIELCSLAQMNIRLILSNAYHLYLRPGMEIIRSVGGLHKFMDWKHNILTDSGGFQLFSLAPFCKIEEQGVFFRSHIDGSAHRLSPEDVVRIQTELGSDILLPLDVCTGTEISEDRAQEALITTTAWAVRSKQRMAQAAEHHYGSLFGIVQGNFFKHLRKRSAEELCALDFDGYAIGGLSVGEAPGLFNEYLAFCAALLPKEKPRYLMGIGTPEYILQAIGEGIDLFDCVFPTRTARNALLFTRQGPINIRNERYKADLSPVDSECACSTCKNHSRAYLRHLFKCKEILAPMLATRHNLFFIRELIESAHTAINENAFLEFKRDFLERYREIS